MSWHLDLTLGTLVGIRLRLSRQIFGQQENSLDQSDTGRGAAQFDIGNIALRANRPKSVKAQHVFEKILPTFINVHDCA